MRKAMPTIHLPARAPASRDGSGSKEMQIAGRLRLLLAMAGFSAVFLEEPGSAGFDPLLGPAFAAYVVFSGVASVAAEWGSVTRIQRLLLWADCAWIALVLALSGGVHSVFFAYFVFPVLVASLRSGFEEGTRMTLCAAALFMAAAAAAGLGGELPLLLFRATFLLALGYLLARFGGHKCQLQRRLELLHGLTPLANPHLGVDRTITAMLGKTRLFFGAERCVAVACVGGRFTLRAVGPDSGLAVAAEPVGAPLAACLLAGGRDATLLYRRPRSRLPEALARRLADWIGTQHDPALEHAAELLGAGSFIAAPLALRNGYGRVFVVRADRGLHRADAMFLAHVAAQALPLVENMALLDRIASNAASDERKRFALNLHDTAVQPYIGLSLGLAALRRKAGAGNPLADDLERLAGMADSVIAELRTFAGSVRGVAAPPEPLCLAALQRQAEQVERCYGVRVLFEVEGRLALGDRIAAEVVQIVREGLTNICRHTSARNGRVRMRCDEALLRIEIDNDSDDGVLPFLPRSISERAAALGGRTFVRRGGSGSTEVCVEIPL